MSILRFEGGPGEPATITLTDFDEDVDIEAPAAADIIAFP
jgi:hypothetical protein